MAAISAGILLFRRASGEAIEVLLVHPGGPFWAKKDLGAWSIPKGVSEEGRSRGLRTARAGGGALARASLRGRAN